MLNLIFALIIFLEIISYLIIADVILSWLSLAGVKFRPAIISAILDPMYLNIKKVFPTTIGPLDLTPIIVLIAISIIETIIFNIFPQVGGLMSLMK
ncbi:MAG: YggT family protein [Candidatus Gracilibacteria bacterium]|nr:YggT family protein [Candidatus Gracilibacteria bacterium]